MKRSAIGALMAMILVIGASAAVAQSAPLKASIPYEFWVNGKVQPPGDYQIRQVGETATLVADANDKSKGLWLLNHCQSVRIEKTKLVFHKLDGHYFLSQVWMHPSEYGLELPPSRFENELRMSYTQVPAGAETVVIGLR